MRETSPQARRALHATGALLLGAILARAAIVAPAGECPRRSLLAGGDMVPGFCADYGAGVQGWPMLVLGLALLALGTWRLGAAAASTRFPATLRLALLACVLGVVALYAAWSYGLAHVCVGSGGGPDADVSCHAQQTPWRAAALVAGGALLGSGATLSLAVLLRSLPFARAPPARG